MIIIDIGACVGLFIEDCFSKYSDIEHIYAIEPHKENFKHTKEKYKDNSKVSVFNFAISDFDGTANFYKKHYNKPGGYDWVGNAGSSLKSDKGNVDSNVFDVVDVKNLNTFMAEQNIKHVDILKIDTEGSEYDILGTILDCHEKFEKILFEDHERKVRSLIPKKNDVLKIINDKKINHKFFLQRGHTEYLPL